ncbi:protein ULTRAPETALA 2 isoform X2 [Solanum pennellii]|uniref:Protein ULTRAPETALA 2 isoform X2 n=1 Tax=Solanum pennellii TaxID=28526 RepID=A0ABM1H607_SOLPN|nr:protein ULTRAPETALA 2 isoform X2 [Solanum pennellii]
MAKRVGGEEISSMENGGNGVVTLLFTEEELREISGVKRCDDYVEVMCGCTSHRYGDAVARLRVFSSGELEITCECTPGCTEDKLTPSAFEKHSGRETARKWKNNVWIIVNGDKVPVVKTPLLKYYNKSLKHAISQNGKACHRDEFLRCTKCNKARRFRLRSKEECRTYHDALANVHWNCSCIPYDKFSCDDEEERASRRVYRGCSRSPTCKGCTTCVCFGCEICRFSDCSCQTCSDFTKNAKG